MADFPFALVELRLHGTGAGVEVGARVAVDRHPQHRPGGLAVDQDDALVAQAHLGDVALHDDRLAVELGEHLEQGVEVFVCWRDVKHPGAAVAEQGLEDDVLVLAAEFENLRAVGGDNGGRQQPLEMGDEQLFRRVSHLHRIVDHQGIGVDVLEQMGCGDVGHVERRVLAHQHHVHGGEIDVFFRPEREVIAALAPHFEGAQPRVKPMLAEHQVLRQVVVDRVAPALRLQRQHEGAVGVDVDGLHGVHLDGDGETHGATLGAPWRVRAGREPP